MYEFKELAKNVYAFVQPPLVMYSSAGVIIGERDVTVIDSLINQPLAEALREEIGKLTDRPVKLLINTHSHADHVYTNHLFSTAPTLCSSRCREKTGEFMAKQAAHDEAFARLFSEVSFSGGRYTLQDMTFDGGMSIYSGGMEVRLIELGPGHSESDVVAFLPDAGIVFCGDIFMNGLPPMPMEGHLTSTIANLKRVEGLGADTFVPGHGDIGGRGDVSSQRSMLERLAGQALDCYRRGMSYDEAVGSFEGGDIPVDFARPSVLSGYCEWSGKIPPSSLESNTDHMQVMRQVASRLLQK